MDDYFIEIYFNFKENEIEIVNKIDWVKKLKSYEIVIDDYDVNIELKFVRIWFYPTIYKDDYVNFTRNMDIEYITDIFGLIIKKTRR